MNLHRDILRLAVPSILANITVPLVGMVDIAVAGHLGASGNLGAAALIGGISIGTMLFDMLYWNFGFLRGGTGGLTAQAYGRHRAGVAEAEADIAVTLKRALGIAFGSGLVLVALQWIVVQVAFLLVDCSPEVQTLATQYFYIRIWAAPATLSLFAFKGWFIGMQDTVRPMICDLLVNATNILFSIGLAFGYAGLPELGFAGVAWGTLIAQWTGFLYASLAVWFRYGWVLKHAKQGGHAAGFREFFVLNRDLFLRSVCMIAVYIGFTMISARYGDMMLAVGAILMKLLMIFSYFTDGFAYAGEALTGRFIGEASPDGVRSTIRQTFVWSLGVTVLFFLVYGVGGVPLLRLMTSDSGVVGTRIHPLAAPNAGHRLPGLHLGRHLHGSDRLEGSPEFHRLVRRGLFRRVVRRPRPPEGPPGDRPGNPCHPPPDGRLFHPSARPRPLSHPPLAQGRPLRLNFREKSRKFAGYYRFIL